VRPAGPAPRKPSDTRSSIIVIAVVILTAILLVVLGFVVLILARDPLAAPQNPGEYGEQAFLVVRCDSLPDARQGDQLSKECSGPGNLPSLTSA
jgi:hypothetical protein